MLLGANDDEAVGVGVGSFEAGAEKEKGEGEAAGAATTGAGEGSFFSPPNENEGVEVGAPNPFPNDEGAAAGLAAWPKLNGFEAGAAGMGAGAVAGGVVAAVEKESC